MTTADGSVLGVQKIVDHGPNADRYNVVLLADGYRDSEMAKYCADVARFVATLKAAAPFDQLWSAINVHRVDVTSTDSGADDPGPAPTAASVRRDRAPISMRRSVRRHPPAADRRQLDGAQRCPRAGAPGPHDDGAVNSTIYGGSADRSEHSRWRRRGRDRAARDGHTAFGLADEYETFQAAAAARRSRRLPGYRGAGRAERHDPDRPGQDQMARVADAAVRRLPTTVNANCSDCDLQPNPKSADYVGAYAARATSTAAFSGRHSTAGCGR